MRISLHGDPRPHKHVLFLLNSEPFPLYSECRRLTGPSAVFPNRGSTDNSSLWKPGAVLRSFPQLVTIKTCLRCGCGGRKGPTRVGHKQAVALPPICCSPTGPLVAGEMHAWRLHFRPWEGCPAFPLLAKVSRHTELLFLVWCGRSQMAVSVAEFWPEVVSTSSYSPQQRSSGLFLSRGMGLACFRGGLGGGGGASRQYCGELRMLGLGRDARPISLPGH